ncbi:BNR-4 repeat-containing protein [Radiobacillus sp. PE A8.2]|uniref:BNR-4 repeat-containing protein n=1 Tax=Radiobacillus sp. PE A8.2 TaxID=3380349 RepID=UPI003890D458
MDTEKLSQQRTLTNDGAWCFFADPRAVYYEGVYKRTYIGWLTKMGDVVIGYYDHDTGEIQSTKIKANLQIDDHANPTILVTKEGYITIYYSAHLGECLFYCTSVSPEDISMWGEERTILGNSEGNHGYTYPNPIQLEGEDNTIYLFWRGGNFKPSFAKTNDGIHWSEVNTLITGSGARPYIKYVSNDIDKIFFAFTDGHPNKEAVNSIYCAYYYAGAIYNLDGTKINNVEKLPIAPSDVDQVYDACLTGNKAWIWDIALDEEENPIIVYAVFHTTFDHRYHYARWTGTKWECKEITSAGSWFPQTPDGKEESEPYYSGGIILDHADPTIVYLSKQVNGIFEIEQWQTNDNGDNWNVEVVTSHSTLNNVRPIVSKGATSHISHLFWLQGRYIHYTDYDMAIKFLK